MYNCFTASSNTNSKLVWGEKGSCTIRQVVGDALGHETAKKISDSNWLDPAIFLVCCVQPRSAEVGRHSAWHFTHSHLVN